MAHIRTLDPWGHNRTPVPKATNPRLGTSQSAYRVCVCVPSATGGAEPAAYLTTSWPWGVSSFCPFREEGTSWVVRALGYGRGQQASLVASQTHRDASRETPGITVERDKTFADRAPGRRAAGEMFVGNWPWSIWEANVSTDFSFRPPTRASRGD